MTHIVNQKCIKCKYTDCVVVCPVNCFHEGPNMLTIDPDVCIDCGVCVAECPVNAIQPDTDDDALVWINLNAEMSKKWPQIVTQKPALPDAEKWAEVENKYPSHFVEDH